MAEINKEKVNELFDKFIKNAEEERDLALERYRRQDIQMEKPEDFVVQGKNAVDFLKTASQRTDSILEAIKLMSGIIYKDSSATGSSGQIKGDDVKKQIKEVLDNKSFELENK
jgi:hypothetical protein